MRWGIAGPGAIAVGFANGLQLLDDADLVAVGSRSIDRATDFAGQYAVPAAYGSYDELAEDPNVEAVYVATPPSCHEADTIRFLEAGKHVLCEKPFALNEAQGRRMVEAARSRGLFLMEAMWSRFLPPYRELARLLDDEVIGEPLFVEADFGMQLPFDPLNRLFDPARGGGGLLDLGVYPVQLASLVLGTPSNVVAIGSIGPTGVDEQVAAVLGHPGGQLAVVKTSLVTNLTFTARIAGTAGTIELPAFMHCPRSITVTARGEQRVIDTSWEGDGLRFQVEAMQHCIAAREIECSIMSHDETLSILHTLDLVREAIGLRFPGE